MLGRLVDQKVGREGFEYPWGDVLPELERADLFLINLDFTLTGKTEPMDPSKPFNFRAEPFVVKALTAGHVDFASNREWLIRRLTELSREFGTNLKPAPHGLSVAVRPE